MHEVHGTRANLHSHFFADATPALTVRSGDTVSVRNVPDVGWGLEPPSSVTAPRRKVDRDPVRDNGPCLCGPIAVEGASAGDTLEIEIGLITPTAWGWTYAGGGMASPAWNTSLGLGDAPLTLLRWSINQEHGIATIHLGHTVAVRPFLGCIGLAPGAQHGDGWTPRACGGNMDCREVTARTRLLLPVMAPGALLSIGDTHAAQGDGEVAGTAIECGLEEARLTLRLHRHRSIRQPRLQTADEWVTLGFGGTLDEAAANAMSEILDLMVVELDISRAEALALASAQVSLRITQVVNPARGVHAVWPITPRPPRT